MTSIGKLLDIILSEINLTAEQKEELKVTFVELFLLSIADQLSNKMTPAQIENLTAVAANAKNDPNRIDNLLTTFKDSSIDKPEMERIVKNAASFSVEKIFHFLNQAPSNDVVDALHSLGR